MGKSGKWIITAIVLLVTGIVICGVSFGVLGFDLGKLSTVTYVTNTYDVSEKFQNISIDGDTENIKFVFSEEEKCRVVCFEEENDLHTVGVEDQTLTIEKKDRKGFWWNVSIATESPSITVYLPEKVYKELSIESDTGDVTGTLLTDKVFITETDTGSVDVPKSVTGGRCEISTDTGDIRIEIQ